MLRFSMLTGRVIHMKLLATRKAGLPAALRLPDRVMASASLRLLKRGHKVGFAAEGGFSPLRPRFGKAPALPKLQPHGESDSLHSQSPTAPYECSSLRTGRASEAVPDPQPL